MAFDPVLLSPPPLLPAPEQEQAYAPESPLSAGSARPRPHWRERGPGLGRERGPNLAGPWEPGPLRAVRCRWGPRCCQRPRRCVHCGGWRASAGWWEPEIRGSCRRSPPPCRSAKSDPPSAHQTRLLRATRGGLPKPQLSKAGCSRRTRRRTRFQRCRSSPPPRSRPIEV